MRLYGRALRSRLDLLRPGRSMPGAGARAAPMRQVAVGQRVMVRDYFRSSKWVPGTVSAVLGPANCMVKTDDGKLWKRHMDQVHDRCSASPPGPNDLGPPPLMSPGPPAAPKPDVLAPTGLADSGCLPSPVLPEGGEQYSSPGAPEVTGGASPSRMSPRPHSPEAPEPGLAGGSVRPGRVRRWPQHLKDFVC